MAISRNDIQNLALLARLALDEDEIDIIFPQIDQLMGQFQPLLSLELAGVEPTSHPFILTPRMRDDVVQPSLSPEKVLANAPEKRDGCFVVPRIIEMT